MAEMQKSRVLLIGLLAGALIMLGAVAIYQATSTSWYRVRVSYTTYPADDEALTAWLRSQPGVSNVTVVREGGTVLISHGWPTGFRRRPIPGPSLQAILDEADRLGYKQRGLLEVWVEETH
jgi:hypothetical protein